MRTFILKPLTLTLIGLGASASIGAEPVTECYENVCATLEAESCVAAGETFDMTVTGELTNGSGFSMTSYQVLRDATWRYNENHQVEVESGEVVDAKGLLFSSSFSQSYQEEGGNASRYTFIFGDRNFGHGFYDVAVEIETGSGGGSNTVALDIKPGACPNPVNAHMKGVLPVAVLGSADFDVRTLDPSSITLAGVPLLRYSFDDVSSPLSGQVSLYECSSAGGDGIEDMTLKFKAEAIVEALETELGRALYDGEVVPLQLNATLKEASSACDSTVTGVDAITVISRGQGKKR